MNVNLTYKNKVVKEEILSLGSVGNFIFPDDNLLIQDDNFIALKSLLKNGFKGKIDLVYIDPPFSTNTTFTATKSRVRTISSSRTGYVVYKDKLNGEYFLEFLRERLILIRELLSPVGSIYLHSDYRIGHYLKVIMDEIFGIENFRNDITRIKCNPKNFERNAYGNIKDLILFYSKTKNIIWNSPTDSISDEEIKKRFKKRNVSGKYYTTIPLHAPGETKNGDTGKEWNGIKPPEGRHWRCSRVELDKLNNNGLIEWSSTGNPRKIVFADEKCTKKKQDIWLYKDPQYPTYPTEKNSDMLKLIIEASSNSNSIVMDCFCGGGTTLVTAENLGRRWIGIDSSPIAIRKTELRLTNSDKNLFSKSLSYKKITSLDSEVIIQK